MRIDKNNHSAIYFHIYIYIYLYVRACAVPRAFIIIVFVARKRAKLKSLARITVVNVV